MSRYIDADAMDKRRIDYIVDGYADSADDMAEWGMAIIEAPSIEIVRCKECKWWSDIYPTRCKRFYGALAEIDDFCSHGEVSEKPTGSERSSE